MDPQTIDNLLALNRRFYAHHAASFSASRARPWPGWGRVLERAAPSADRPFSVLDLGCGNGRFAAFLALQAPKLDYLGIDNAPALLALARQRLAGRVAAENFRCAELTADNLAATVGTRRFDLIALFGVLHHIPGLATRRTLLGSLAPWLQPGGLIAATVWRFDADPRLARRAVPWQHYNRTAAVAVEATALEAGDHLLSWQGDATHPRYCHLADDGEIAHLLATLPYVVRERFDADGATGNQNHYLLLTSEPTS